MRQVPSPAWLAAAALAALACGCRHPGALDDMPGQTPVSLARQARYDLRYRDLAQGDPVTFFAGGNSAIRTDLFHEVGGFSREGTGGDIFSANGTPVFCPSRPWQAKQ